MRASLLVLGLSLLVPSVASADSVGVLVVSTSGARRMFDVSRTRRVERAIRQAVARDAVVRRRETLSGEAAQCLLDEPACRRAVRSALHADRVYVVQLGHARGPCVPMRRGGRVVGRRMLRVGTLAAAPLGQPLRAQRLQVGASDDEWLAALREVLEGL